MITRRTLCTVVGILVLALWSAPCSAELNLWVSRHLGGIEANDDGSYAEAEALLRAAVEECAGEPDFRRAVALDKLGMACTAREKYTEAEGYYEQALEIKEGSLGERSREVPKTLNNIADLHYILGKLDDVESLYRRSLDIHRRDQRNIEVCRAFNGLALLHADAGENVEAENLLKRAITIHEKASRRYHPYLATCLVNLGILYTRMDRCDEAEPLFERAEYIHDQMLGDEHPDVAIRLLANASLLAKTGRPDEALELQARGDAMRAKFAQANVGP